MHGTGTQCTYFSPYSELKVIMKLLTVLAAPSSLLTASPSFAFVFCIENADDHRGVMLVGNVVLGMFLDSNLTSFELSFLPHLIFFLQVDQCHCKPLATGDQSMVSPR